MADARVEEDEGALLAFVVTLSRAAASAFTVDYATADGSAQAGVDYTAASGTLSFQAGESSQTIEVAVLDDSHDEGEETLTLTLSNASRGRLTDDEATGTIKNRDPLRVKVSSVNDPTEPSKPRSPSLTFPTVRVAVQMSVSCAWTGAGASAANANTARLSSIDSARPGRTRRHRRMPRRDAHATGPRPRPPRRQSAMAFIASDINTRVNLFAWLHTQRPSVSEKNEPAVPMS